MSADITQLRALPVAEKLQIVEQLWDDIADADGAEVVQEWHKAEARQRAAELQADPDIALTREELWQRVDQTDG